MQRGVLTCSKPIVLKALLCCYYVRLSGARPLLPKASVPICLARLVLTAYVLFRRIFLVPCIAVIDRLSGKPLSFWGTDDSHKRGDLITGGLCCGVLLTIASTLQQTGIAYTSAGKAGFITALYIVIIPILGLLVKNM